MKLITLICAGLLSIHASTVFSEPPQSGGAKALEKAMFLLNNPAAREAYLQNSDSALNADETLRDLAGSEQTTEEIYRLASDIFAKTLLNAKGDPDKLLQLLQQAEQDPEAFADNFTPEQKKKLGDLARQVERNWQ